MEHWKNRSIENIDGEAWVPIPGFEGWYEGSTMGRLKGVDRILRNGHKWKGRIISQSIGTHKYLSACLYKDFIQHTNVVHIWIAQTHIPNPRGCKYVNHKKGNRLDNRATELEWNTKSEDEQHSINILGKKSSLKGKVGKDCNRSKPVLQFDKNGVFIAEFDNQKLASEAVGISFTGISSAATGRQKTAKGFIWKFKNP